MLENKKNEYLSVKQIEARCSDLSQENDYICETAGFVPLEVKFKRFELAGQAAVLNASEFTSQDIRDLYLNPDFDIYPDDDLDEIETKMIALRKHQQEIISKVALRSEATRQAVSATAIKEESQTSEPKDEVDQEV